MSSKTRSTRRFALVTLATLFAGGVIGGLVGVQAEPQNPTDQFSTFTEVLTLVRHNYVGDVDAESMVEGAIDGLLETLDPHSNYLNAESFSDMRDEQRGKFSGLGIQITKRGADKPLTIITPIDDTPAYRAGLKSGDVIANIEGQPTIDLTVHEAVRLLKGGKGTRVTITIRRPGLDETFDVTIERDDIPIESIRVAYMLTPDVGVIRISNFTTTTANELDEAVAQLSEQGMDKLLLDLRGNPGGLLDQAVQVSERFLSAGKLIVYTRGRIPGSNQDYFAKRGVDRLSIPLILLVDGSSASASEIVSGAMQDHDRGLVVGEATFGKGLVQRVMPLQQGGALAVTTAKYYTPAGRLIQRDYTDLEAYYLRQDEESPEAVQSDAEDGTAIEEREVFYTASGREVYGGGGIRPDYEVEIDPPPSVLLKLFRENLIFDYSVLYSKEHPELEKNFTLGDEDIAEFRLFLDQNKFEMTEEEFTEGRSAVEVRLRAQIGRLSFDQKTESKILAEADPQVLRALELFDEAADLARRGQESRPDRPEQLPLRAQVSAPSATPE